MMVKVSLRVLAEACGVSTATVSRALFGHTPLRAALRGEIAAAAAKLGYRRNELVGKLMVHVRGGERSDSSET